MIKILEGTNMDNSQERSYEESTFNITKRERKANEPTPAFIGISWLALSLGVGAYLLGLWNATMMMNEKGYYLIVLLYGLFSAVSVQKTVRDRDEGIPTTSIYYGLSWFSVIVSSSLLTYGLWNAELLRSEKGFYGMAFTLSMFAAVAVQKNVRDLKASEDDE